MAIEQIILAAISRSRDHNGRFDEPDGLDRAYNLGIFLACAARPSIAARNCFAVASVQRAFSAVRPDGEELDEKLHPERVRDRASNEHAITP
ncbi:hypothetical protein FHR22_000910 [Sphingopyxis panaciterrae]|nr:hypothetical protein [Sphingopyxis panaciterrae]